MMEKEPEKDFDPRLGWWDPTDPDEPEKEPEKKPAEDADAF